ncbi:MAG: polyprenyl synthetase family protein [Bacteroidota bacterium]
MTENQMIATPLPTLQRMVEEGLANLELGGQPAELYDPIAYILEAGGKRMRPVLALMGCELFGAPAERALSQALAVEVFHNFTLVHDDIMDQAPVRRNRPTIHHKWNDNTAILSGDVMLVLAYELLIQAEPTLLPRLLHTFNEGAKRVCEGQQWDMNFETTAAVTIPDYIGMIRGKTSALLGASLRLGAIMGGADTTAAAALYDYGENLGLAFQLQDDWLDVYGDPEKFGKRVGGDIVSNKKTWLLLKATELASGPVAAELEELLRGREISDAEKVRAVTAIYDRLGIRELARDAVEAHYQVAQRHLEGLPVDAQRKDPLNKLADRLMARES